MPESDVVLEIKNLRTHFALEEGVVKSVDGVNFTVPAGKTVCVVGESGCGKSITARSILRLIEHPGRIVDGEILWKTQGSDRTEQLDELTEVREKKTRGRRARRAGRATVEGASATEGGWLDLAKLDPSGERLRQIRGGEIAMIFQEPMASLSPMYTVENHLVEAMQVHLDISDEDARERGLELLRHVGIPRPEHTMASYPFQLSGGMCQRVMTAIALSCRPQLLIADEPTTALDVTTQARIIDLLIDLQADTGMAMIFITHDLGVVAEIADEVVVMYLGTVVEQGKVDDIFHNPKHPYTRSLLGSIPRMGRGSRQPLSTIRGHVPHPLRRPTGCPFNPRCDSAIEGLCEVVDPPMVELGNRQRARCVLHDPQLMESVNRTEASEVSA